MLWLSINSQEHGHAAHKCDLSTGSRFIIIHLDTPRPSPLMYVHAEGSKHADAPVTCWDSCTHKGIMIKYISAWLDYGMFARLWQLVYDEEREWISRFDTFIFFKNICTCIRHARLYLLSNWDRHDPSQSESISSILSLLSTKSIVPHTRNINQSQHFKFYPGCLLVYTVKTP